MRYAAALMSALQTVFDVFSVRFPDREKYAAFDAASAKALEERVPAELLALLTEEGLFTFANGLFRFVDPQTMKPANQSWKLDPGENTIFLRTAFGDLFYWDGSAVNVLHVNSGVTNALDSEIPNFLNYTFSESYREKTLFGRFLQKACDRLGPLAPDEAYGFVPALPAGGKESATSLQKVRLNEYLDLLAQLHQ
jgi:hypothetical protein